MRLWQVAVYPLLSLMQSPPRRQGCQFHCFQGRRGGAPLVTLLNASGARIRSNTFLAIECSFSRDIVFIRPQNPRNAAPMRATRFERKLVLLSALTQPVVDILTRLGVSSSEIPISLQSSLHVSKWAEARFACDFLIPPRLHLALQWDFGITSLDRHCVT